MFYIYIPFMLPGKRSVKAITIVLNN